jgi:hypothetical protein
MPSFLDPSTMVPTKVENVLGGSAVGKTELSCLGPRTLWFGKRWRAWGVGGGGASGRARAKFEINYEMDC